MQYFQAVRHFDTWSTSSKQTTLLAGVNIAALNSQFHSASVLFRISFVIQVTWRFVTWLNWPIEIHGDNGGHKRCTTVKRFWRSLSCKRDTYICSFVRSYSQYCFLRCSVNIFCTENNWNIKYWYLICLFIFDNRACIRKSTANFRVTRF